MTITHVTALRNTLAQAVADAFLAGSGQNAMLELRDATTAVVRFDLADPPFGSPSVGIITAQGLPVEVQAIASGDLDNFILYDQDGVQLISGSVTATGMGGDIEVTNTNVASGQDCSLDSLTYEAPA